MGIHNMGGDESKQRWRNHSDNEKSKSAGALYHSSRSFHSHSIIHTVEFVSTSATIPRYQKRMVPFYLKKKKKRSR